MSIKARLWIAYWVMGASALFVIFSGGNFWIAEGMAIVAAAFGWAAFLRD